MSAELWIASIVLWILGILIAAFGLIFRAYGRRDRPYSGYAEAEVVDIVPASRGAQTHSAFQNRQAAVFQFYADGKLIKITDDTDTYPCPYSLHQRVYISYSPDDPKRYAVLREEKTQYGGTALNIFGVFLIMIGCLCFFLYASRYSL